MNIDFITALKNGAVRGIAETPERHVETVLSDVFLYADTVRKIYKPRKGIFFGDLSDPTFRKSFFKEDFAWNRLCSPEIHTGLHGVRAKDGCWEICDYEQADDFFIEMRRIDERDTLVKRLLNKEIGSADVTALTHNLAQKTDTLTEQYAHDFRHIYERGWDDIFRERLEDLREWGYIAKHTIPRTVTDKYIERLANFVERTPYFAEMSTDNFSVTIDNHAGNVVFIPSGEPRFIDIYLTKELWRVVDHNLAISRIAACVRALGDDALADAMYDTYAHYRELAPKEILDFYECYNACIKAYYYLHLKEPDISTKYFALADRIAEGYGDR